MSQKKWIQGVSENNGPNNMAEILRGYSYLDSKESSMLWYPALGMPKARMP